MQLFRQIRNPQFFSLLASPNREIYADALFVVYRCYKQELLIRRQDLVDRLVASLEDRMFELAEEEGEAIDDSSLSGRAHWLIRRLLGTGWIELDPTAHTADEYVALPDHSVRILQVLYEISEDKPKEYNSLVYSTYSNLSKAQEERGDFMAEALVASWQLTDRLVDSLKSLYNNMRSYYLALQEQDEVREVLREHFDRYQVLIADRIYHPLKTFDSVPRFRPRILSILREWLADGRVLQKIRDQLVSRGHYGDAATAGAETMRMIMFIVDQYENMDRLLKEIDRKNAAYTRASVERTRYLLNTNRGARGQLIEILKELPRIHQPLPAGVAEDLAGTFSLFEQHWLDEGSLYREPKQRRFEKAAPLQAVAAINKKEFAAEFEQLKQRVRDSLSDKKVLEFMLKQLGGRESIRASELELTAMEDFLKLILAVIKNDETNLPYRISFEEGSLSVNGFRIPDMTVESGGASPQREQGGKGQEHVDG